MKLYVVLLHVLQVEDYPLLLLFCQPSLMNCVHLNAFETDYIRRSLTENKGNKETTANKLGVDLATLYRKLKKLRIETA